MDIGKQLKVIIVEPESIVPDVGRRKPEPAPAVAAVVSDRSADETTVPVDVD